jgi:hypothetical protein
MFLRDNKFCAREISLKKKFLQIFKIKKTKFLNFEIEIIMKTFKKKAFTYFFCKSLEKGNFFG